MCLQLSCRTLGMFCLTLNILRPVKSGSSRRREQTMTLGSFRNLGFEVQGSVALTPNWLLDPPHILQGHFFTELHRDYLSTDSQTTRSAPSKTAVAYR